MLFRTIAHFPALLLTGATVASVPTPANTGALHAAILKRSGPACTYGTAQIGQSPACFAYVDQPGLCGSGGCLPQIWRKTAAVFVFLIPPASMKPLH